MTEKQLIRHLHMGCGESLKTDIGVKRAVDKNHHKKQEKLNNKQAEKALRSCWDN